ncbi:MAG: cytochrome d ubiquinol oxidase subunit II [Candidatus Poribacteria bacterium]|nr:cytochrome d ubiquinol oxidase subunit II [Candidatus Poribacteria bacterium]
MFSLEIWIAGVMLISLIIYMLTGGADFGGGVWDLFATGPRAKTQRNLITNALAPIWEANHVWLIVIVVLLFVAFPVAFATIGTALHIPLTLMLIGIVLRGTAFVFRTYDDQSDKTHLRWSRVFAIASIITPIMLGVTLGAVASGTIHVDIESGTVDTDFFSSWFAPFPFAIGFFTLTLCALLAAVYLTLETDNSELQEDFRVRAIIAAVSVGATAGISFLLSAKGAPSIRQGLGNSVWSIPFHILTGAVAVCAIWSIWRRYFQIARVLVPIQVVLIIFGWGLAQFPYIVAPNLTFSNTAAPDSVLRPVLIVVIIGGIILAPAFWYLYAVFKGASRTR